MSCSPCGYSYPSNPQPLLMTGQHPSLQYPASSGMAPDSLPAGSGLLPYDGRLLPYSQLYASYPDPVAASYMAASHHAVLYPPSLASPYDIKDPRTAWSSLPQAGAYDPILAYSPYDRFDPVDSEARRRNATRETTSTLKAWLNEHRKNPYPTKGEKIMLAIITKMTLTQVSTWFANARRRLKKENKMTWEPRNKTGDDLDDVSSDEDDEKDPKMNGDEPKSDGSEDTENLKNSDSGLSRKRLNSCDDPSSPIGSKSNLSTDEPEPKRLKSSPELTDLPPSLKPEEAPTPEKPKIWSLAQTATSDSPPSLRKLQQQVDHQRPPLYSSEINFSSQFHKRLQDSSAESSLSSPPLWRTDMHGFGRSTPMDPSDLTSVSPSSTGSPSVVATSVEQASAVSPSVSYNRMMGSRFIPCNEGLQGVPRPSPMDYSSYYSHMGGLAPTIDMRTFHPHPYLRPPSYYAVGFTCAPPSMYHNHPPVTTISKSKSDEGNSSRCES